MFALAASARGTSDWRERLEKIGSLEELRALVVQLRAASESLTAADDDVAPSLVRATLWLVVESSDTPDAPEYIAWARAACERFGSDDDRARAEWFEAERLRQAGSVDSAHELATNALAHLPKARKNAVLLHQLLYDIARQSGDLIAALEHASHAIDALVDLSPLAGEDVSDHALLRCSLFGDRGRVYLDCGLPDLAAIDFAAENEAVIRLRRTWGAASNEGFVSSIDRAEDKSLLDRIAGKLSSQDDQGALDLVAERASIQRPFTPDLLAEFVLEQGNALSERARSSGNSAADLARADQVLLSVSAIPGASDATRMGAEFRLVDLALRKKDVDLARERLAKVRAHMASRRAQHVPAGSPEELARVEAHAASLALQSGASVSVLEEQRVALRQAFENFLTSWSHGRPRPGGLGFLFWGTQRLVMSDLVRLETAIDPSEAGVERALGVVLAAENVGSRVRSLTRGEIDLATVRKELLGAGTVVLVVLPSMDRSHIFAFDRAHAVVELTVARDEIESRRREFVRHLMTSPRSLENDAARAQRREAMTRARNLLSKALLPPKIQAMLVQASDVVVVGADLVGGAPFESLVLDDGRELGLTFAMTSMPSLPLGVAFARRRDVPSSSSQPRADQLVLIAAPDHGLAAEREYPNLRPIPFTAEMEARIVAPFAAHSVHTGSGASLETLRATPGRVVEIFAHGVFDRRREFPTGIALSGDATHANILWSEGVASIPPAPFIALFACSPARGPTRMGDDTATHLGSVLLDAGFDGVLVNRAEFDFESAVAWCTALNRELARGVAPAEAMRRARVQLANDSATADPFDYGLVGLLGLGDRALYAAPNESEATSWKSPRLLALVGATLAAGLAAYALVRRKQ